MVTLGAVVAVMAVALAFLVAHATASSRDSVEPVPAPTETVDRGDGSTIAGTVLGAPDLTPLSGAEVRVYDAANALVDTAATGASGAFTTVVLPTGTYYARTYNWSGFLDELYDDLPCYSGCNPSGGQAIAVAADAPVDDVDFVLDPGGWITGVVIDQVDAPIVGAEVSIYDASGALRAWATTSQRGVFSSRTSRGLITGNYFAVATAAGASSVLYDDLPCAAGCDPLSGTPIGVTTGLETGGVQFRLFVAGPGFADGFETGTTERWSATIP